MQLNLNELRELLAALDRTDISELTIKSGDFELTVRKGPGIGDRPPLDRSSASGVPALGVAAYASAPAATPHVPIAGTELAASGTAQTDAGAARAGSTAVAPPSDTKKWVDVISPMVGTFYCSSAPDESPFVEVGDRIRLGQTVCIIEAMKLMNEIEAEISGQVMELLGKNGEPVEYGQVLMRINPD